jgi:hypothetical protein
MAIKSIEWLGTYEAQQLIVKSAWMRDEVQRSYKTPRDKLSVVLPNSNGWLKDTLKIYKNVAEKGEET